MPPTLGNKCWGLFLCSVEDRLVHQHEDGFGDKFGVFHTDTGTVTIVLSSGAPSVISVVVDSQDSLGEGIIWSGEYEALFWVDIEARRLHRYRLVGSEHQVWELPFRASGLATRSGGGLVLATDVGVCSFDLKTGIAELLVVLEPQRPDNRSNEAKCDSDGRFWVGTMDARAKTKSGALYRVGHDLAVQRVVDGMGIPNTLVWSHDGRSLYSGDSMDSVIYRYDYHAARGEIVASSRVEFVSTRDELACPDGSTIDAEGHLWNCQWDGGRVVRYAPDGSISRIVQLPVTRPTTCTFGGAALDTLFISTARVGLNPEQLRGQPNAGNVLAFRPGVNGVSEPSFLG